MMESLLKLLNEIIENPQTKQLIENVLQIKDLERLSKKYPKKAFYKKQMAQLILDSMDTLKNLPKEEIFKALLDLAKKIKEAKELKEPK